MRRLVPLALVVAFAPAAWAAPPDGLWDAKLRFNDVEVPFRIELSGRGESLVGTLFDGDRKVPSTSGRLDDDGRFVLTYDHFLTRIEGSVKDDRLEAKLSGRFTNDGSNPYSILAVRHQPPKPVADAPDIAGTWEIPVKSGKGEAAWRLIVRQNGGDVSATILRVDGDTGDLSGSFDGDKFVLGHFAGSVPYRVEIAVAADQTLSVRQQGAFSSGKTLTAYRPEAARAKGLPGPTDPAKHTSVADPGKPFEFRFPDVDGKIRSNEDPEFQGKVLVVVVTGTWCPNCHDEAQHLVEVYKKYHDEGLEIVALDFEDPEQQEELTRVRAFIERYQVQYPVLIAGSPAEMWAKIPQATNLNSWPTTFFIGRDGRTRDVVAGFPGPASGDFHKDAKNSFNATIERLLSENKTASR